MQVTAPSGPTGKLWKDWGPDSIHNVKRKIALYLSSSQNRCVFVTKAELIRVWDIHAASLPPNENDLLIAYAIDLLAKRIPAPRGRKTPSKPESAAANIKSSDIEQRIAAFRENSQARDAYITRGQVCDALLSRLLSSTLTKHDYAFTFYIKGMLDNTLKRPRGRLPLKPIEKLFDRGTRGAYDELLVELQAMDRSRYVEFCSQWSLGGPPAHVAMAVIKRQFYPTMGVDSVRTRLFGRGEPKT